MAVLGVLLLVGIVLTLRWNGTDYEPWEPSAGPDEGVRGTAARYLRGLAIGVTAGFWTGALLTGPAMRLIMRLLAVTAGAEAQGRITEAEEVVGNINLGGTLGLYIFGGILPGLVSGVAYIAFRRLLPNGRWAGPAFGALHLVLLATRLDPLRADNPDFDIVGPGWLSALTFGLASIAHGMAVVALANRYSRSFPPAGADRRTKAKVIAPLVPAALIFLPGVAVLGLVAVGLVLTLVLSRVPPLVAAVRSRAAVTVGRVAIAVLVAVTLPGTLGSLRDVVDRDARGADAARP